MSVRISLDQHDVPFYTNLDFISGRVLLTLHNDATISAINVKLEGESRTRLAGPKHPHDRPEKIKTELELHKLLYKVQTVFPSQEVLQHGSMNTQYTLAAGQYEYPFRFKFPFNNDCKSAPFPFQDLTIGQLGVQFAQEPARHLKRPLPPSLGGFPGEAEIKYFVKTTVVRPKFYQENLRVQYGVKFLPIEPPRAEQRNEEQYARRQHQFQPARRESKLNLLRKAPEADEEPPNVKLDARLPSPPIMTCHRPLPLRVFIERVNQSPASIYLTMLQIELIAFTDIQAHDLKRTEISSWILVSKANMDMRLWDQVPLPNTVIPSFECCNLKRKYELEVRVGLSHSLADRSKPEVVVLPLRLPCEVFSGVVPPPELLQRIKVQGGPITSNSTASPIPHGRPPSDKHGSIPISASTTTPIVDSKFPTLPPTSSAPSRYHTDEDDLPPSYEDAMAEDIGPFDGPRQHFETQEVAQPQQPAYSGDSKSSGGLNRHPSERLFAQNAPRAPGTDFTTTTSFPSDPTSPVDEEPDPSDQIPQNDIDGMARGTAALNVSGLNGDVNADPLPPPLPARKPAGTNDDPRPRQIG